MKNIELSQELKPQVIKLIKAYFLSEQDEEISDFKASLLLDFILAEIGPYIYNQAVNDAHQMMLERVEELFDLEKRPR